MVRNLGAQARAIWPQEVELFRRYALSEEARRRGLDGVVCGHIHHAEIRDLGGMLYCNDGDWVESCTALVEHFDGRLEIIHWIPIMERSSQVSAPAQEPAEAFA